MSEQIKNNNTLEQHSEGGTIALIKNILKGAVIGLANIIPGVSGGTMMVSMGIYDKLIHCITHIFKEFKKCVKFLAPIAVGMVLGILVLAKVISLLFDKMPLQTNCLFVGLIVGSLPFIYKNVKGKKFKLSHGIAFVLFLALVIGSALLGSLGSDEGGTAAISHNSTELAKLFGIGVIASATMIIPGVSGSMVLMILGYYETIIDAINDFMKNLIHFNMSGIMDGLFILVPFGIGIVVGVVVIAKLIDIIFKKYPSLAYWAILGLIVASPVAIFLAADIPSVGGALGIITSVLAFVVGAMAGNKLGGE